MREERDENKRFIFSEIEYQSVKCVLIPSLIENIDVKIRIEIIETDVPWMLRKETVKFLGNSIKACRIDEERHSMIKGKDREKI